MKPASSCVHRGLIQFIYANLTQMNCLDHLPVSRSSESKGIPENGRTWSVDPQCVCHTMLVPKFISLGEPAGCDSFPIHDRSQRVLFRYPCIPLSPGAPHPCPLSWFLCPRPVSGG